MMAEYSEFLKLSPEEFDQDQNKGWRKLDNAGRPLEAVEAIKKYLELNTHKLKTEKVRDINFEQFMHFHIGQLLAMSGQEYYSEAIKHFEQSLIPTQKGWNFYVDGSIAFLLRDTNRLNKNIADLEGLEKELGIGIINLNILLNFSEALKNNSYSYKKSFNAS